MLYCNTLHYIALHHTKLHQSALYGFECSGYVFDARVFAVVFAYMDVYGLLCPATTRHINTELERD